MELRKHLQRTLKCHLPPTLTFDYLTGETWLDYLQELLPADFSEAAEEKHVAVQEEEKHASHEADPSFEELARQLAQKLGVDIRHYLDLSFRPQGGISYFAKRDPSSSAPKSGLGVTNLSIFVIELL